MLTDRSACARRCRRAKEPGDLPVSPVVITVAGRQLAISSGPFADPDPARSGLLILVRDLSAEAEAERVAEAVESLGLSYVVLTAVARDDMADHGASLFTATMAAIRRRQPQVAIEVLTPDFWGGYRDEAEGIAAQRQRLAAVLAAEPVCFNHNLETVQRLQGEVRRGATYTRSLALLAAARELEIGRAHV